MDKSVTFLSINIYVIYLCSIVNKILARVILKSLFSFYSNKKQRSQHLRNLGCIIIVIIKYVELCDHKKKVSLDEHFLSHTQLYRV